MSSNSSVGEIVTALNEKAYHRLKALRGAPASDRNELRADLLYCDGCLLKGYLTLTSVTPKDGDDEGEEEEELVSDVAIDPPSETC